MPRPRKSPQPQTPVYEFQYRGKTLSQYFDQLGILPTPFAHSIGHSGLGTLDRWLEGKDIYVIKLMEICNKYRMNPLAFLTVNGHEIRTNLSDLYLYEKAGLSVRDELRRIGQNPSKDDECHSLMGHPDQTDADDGQPSTPPTGISPANLSPDMLDRIIAMQTQAHEHERQALDRQRQDLQQIIKQKDELITELQRELKKLRTKDTLLNGYGFVADDSKL